MKFFAERIHSWSFPTIYYEPMGTSFCGEKTHSVGIAVGPYVVGVEWIR